MFPTLLILNTFSPSTFKLVACLHALTIVSIALLYDHIALSTLSSSVILLLSTAGTAAIAPKSSLPSSSALSEYALIKSTVFEFSLITIYCFPPYVT